MFVLAPSLQEQPMIFTGQDPIEALRDVLEEQYEQHSVRLADLVARAARTADPHHSRSRSRDDGRHGDGKRSGSVAGQAALSAAAEAEVAASRRELAEIARALRHMAEGVYGRCESCLEKIPLDRLRVRPHTRFCAPCETRPGL
ncbi:hypothetical protein GQS52_24405 [Streptomyces sp. SCUT-3]|uniref:TraR/DksA family transcriptional regulator n=1 Tax=Streptomyces sp. SCUT-3 TaxID=2684469 RepID=UPI000CB1C097|nr:TraR/DksA C4-type zinc finger protein [Streptomyces sp. SCUT-3]PLW73502.1 hypothetical protein C0036_06890 [Streptomyces sp. DJ]QMV24399.1 hypothetical protein GQS52_24405 [Streptomyces sp. SCUT-3]